MGFWSFWRAGGSKTRGVLGWSHVASDFQLATYELWWYQNEESFGT